MNSAVDPLNAENSLRAKLPAVVKKLVVSVGDHVQEGDLLLILEAMKMEHVLEAPRGGVVKALHAGEGATVDDGLLLVEIIDEMTTQPSKSNIRSYDA